MATAGEFVGTDFVTAANVAQSTGAEVDAKPETRFDVDRVSGAIALGASAVFLAMGVGNLLVHRPDAATVYFGIAVAAAIYGASSLFASHLSRSPGYSNQN
jgi:hypothetical protein